MFLFTPDGLISQYLGDITDEEMEDHFQNKQIILKLTQLGEVKERGGILQLCVKVDDDSVIALAKIWSTFTDNLESDLIGNDREVIKTLLRYTARIIFSGAYMQRVSATAKSKLTESFRNSAKKCTDVSQPFSSLGRICNTLVALSVSPWTGKIFQAAINEDYNNKAIEELWQSEGWFFLEARLETIGRIRKQVSTEMIARILKVCAIKGNSWTETGVYANSTGDLNAFDAFNYNSEDEYCDLFEACILFWTYKHVDINFLARLPVDDLLQTLKRLHNRSDIDRCHLATRLWAKEDSRQLCLKFTNNIFPVLLMNNMDLKTLTALYEFWLKLNLEFAQDDERLHHVRLMIDRVSVSFESVLSTDYIFFLASFLLEKLGLNPVIREIFVELFVRALVLDINFMEKCRVQVPVDAKQLKTCSEAMSNRIFQLSSFLEEYHVTSRNLLLTSFSLKPSKKVFKSLFPETGPVNDFKSMENLHLPEDLCNDLLTVIHKPRWTALGRCIKEEELRINCEKLLQEDYSWLHVGRQNSELQYVNVNYDDYKHLPSKYDPNDDGIERGFTLSGRRKKKKVSRDEAIMKLFKFVSRQKICDSFKRLPSAHHYPDYYKQIKSPISLATIKGRIKRNEYLNFTQIQADMNTMFENAKEFNTHDSTPFISALMMQEILDAKVAELNLQKDLPAPNIVGNQIFYEDSESPDNSDSMKQVLMSIFNLVCKHQDKDGRHYTETLLKIAEKDEAKGQSVQELSLNLVKRRLERGDYKRLVSFQRDILLCFGKARKQSRADSKLYNDVCELESFFVKKMDELSENEKLLKSRWFAHTESHLIESMMSTNLEKQTMDISQEDYAAFVGVQQLETECTAFPRSINEKLHKQTTGMEGFISNTSGGTFPGGAARVDLSTSSKITLNIENFQNTWTDADGTECIEGVLFYWPSNGYEFKNSGILLKNALIKEKLNTYLQREFVGTCYLRIAKEGKQYLNYVPEGSSDDSMVLGSYRYYTSRENCYTKLKAWAFGSCNGFLHSRPTGHNTIQNFSTSFKTQNSPLSDPKINVGFTIEFNNESSISSSSCLPVNPSSTSSYSEMPNKRDENKITEGFIPDFGVKDKNSSSDFEEITCEIDQDLLKFQPGDKQINEHITSKLHQELETVLPAESSAHTISLRSQKFDDEMDINFVEKALALKTDPKMIFECSWQSCNLQFEEPLNFAKHVVQEVHGHITSHYNSQIQDGNYKCLWKSCICVKTFPTFRRLLRHVRKCHILKGNGRILSQIKRIKKAVESHTSSILKMTSVPHGTSVACTSREVLPERSSPSKGATKKKQKKWTGDQRRQQRNLKKRKLQIE